VKKERGYKGSTLQATVSFFRKTKGRTCGAWQLREPGYTCS